MLKLGDVELKGRFSLAPMAGVSDTAFRDICSSMGAALTVTEMVSAKALVYRDEKTKSLLYSSGKDMPLACQIFGHEPDVMAEAAALALELSKAQILDINMGCPVGKIVRAGDGSALMSNLPLASSIIKAVKSAVSVPVTVKFRKGPDNGHVNAVEFAKMCEDSGADMICVHGRTRAQMYSGRSDPDIIRDVKKAVKIPVSANGDIFTAEDAVHLLKYTGCDMAAIARGSFGNPWIFRDANALINGNDIPAVPTLAEKMDMAFSQIKMLSEITGERYALLEARHQVPWYLHGVPRSGIYKEALVHVSTLEELKKICSDIKRDLK